MRIFTDTNKLDWSLDLTVGSIRRVQSLTGVNLLDAREGSILVDIADDPIKMADILYAIVQPQASARGITDEAFGASLDGDTLRVAIEAFIDELIDFFRRFRPDVGRVLETLWAKIQKISDEMGTLAMKKMESPELENATRRAIQAIESQIDARIAGSSGIPSTNSPA
jgi:hypothetical protein